MTIEDDEYFIGYKIKKCYVNPKFRSVIEFSTSKDRLEAMYILYDKEIPFLYLDQGTNNLYVRTEDEQQIMELLDNYDS